MAKNRANKLCCLCGRLSTDENPITREHVPPKQFYPEKLRRNVNLWVVASCESCNREFKSHEEYFLHALYPLVQKLNPSVADVVWEDLKRRAKQHQTRHLLRKILREARRTTLGGIVLPPGAVELSIDLYRIQQVAMKIARCLYFLECDRFLPKETCKDIRICTSEDEVPEMYRISWEFDKVSVLEARPAHADTSVVVADDRSGLPSAVLHNIFSYRTTSLDHLVLYSLQFWGAIMICMAFEEPATMTTQE